MNCREFRRKHDAYIDDTLSGVDLEAMALHRSLCAACAQLDTRVRRSLLVAHNLPIIQPSAAFSERLQARLASERLLMQAGHAQADLSVDRWRPLSLGTYAALAAGVLAVAGLAGAVTVVGSRNQTIRLAPVVASIPEPMPSLMTNPAMVASMPAGMPLWPAVFVAQQAPYHFASDALGSDFVGH
ncbi:MAG: hypothetical protein ABJE47_02285 [bacterium]